MPRTREFTGTLVTFLVATCFAVLTREWLLGIWLSPALESAGGVDIDVFPPSSAALSAMTRQVTMATALLLTLPVLGAEGWLFLCRVTRREQARSLSIPFGVLSGAAVLLALWLARRVELVFFSWLL